ncbi:MAG: flagellar basal body-associated FliL family protein [Porticoccus sp.]
MADVDNELNLGQGGKQSKQAKEKESGGMKKIIMIVVALLLVGGGAAAFFLMGGESDQPAAEDGAEIANTKQSEEPDEAPIYLALDPAFVVNFEHNGSIRYLQLSLQIMSYEQAAIDKVFTNMPAVRNSLIMLFSGQDYDYLNTVEGKENLRKEVLTSIHQVVRLKNNLKVNDVFFTGFVMQ